MKQLLFASGLVLGLGLSALAQERVKASGGSVTNYIDADGASWVAYIFTSVRTNRLEIQPESWSDVATYGAAVCKVTFA